MEESVPERPTEACAICGDEDDLSPAMIGHGWGQYHRGHVCPRCGRNYHKESDGLMWPGP